MIEERGAQHQLKGKVKGKKEGEKRERNAMKLIERISFNDISNGYEAVGYQGDTEIVKEFLSKARKTRKEKEIFQIPSRNPEYY
jgi:hypothetical protein